MTGTDAATNRKTAGTLGGLRLPDWFEWCCLAGTALVSVMVLGPLLATGHQPSGADGAYPIDQFQYLAWIRQASEHFLIGNPFDSLPDHRVFLHPGFLLSGLVHRWTGLPLVASYPLVWKPISVAAVFVAALLYSRRLLPSVWPRRVGLLLALFAIPPWSALMKWTGITGAERWVNLDFFIGEISQATYLQGYAMTAIAVSGIPLTLLMAERLRSARTAGLLAAVSAATLLVTWLQPWQGAELLLIIVLAESWRWARHGERPWPGLALPMLSGSLPAAYYWAISHSDASWRLAGAANSELDNPLWSFPLWAVLLGILPLAAAALAALRRKDCDWQQGAVRIWPLAIAIVYFLPVGTFPFHAAQGLGIPLAMLAVEGATSQRPRWFPQPRGWWVVPVIAIMIVPGLAHRSQGVIESVDRDRNARAWWLEPGESEALRYVETAPGGGTVIADSRLGPLVPAFTGHEVYAGNFSWTPDFTARSIAAGAIFSGRSLFGPTTPAIAQLAVRRSGARYVIKSCASGGLTPAAVEQLIAPMIERTLQFGCSHLFVIRQSAGADRDRPALR